LLVLNIDARTFHGCPVVHARFNLETYTFNRIPEEEVEAARQGKAQAEAEEWVLKIWKSKPLNMPATNADGIEKWNISRQGASGRFGKLEAAGVVARADSQAGQAVKWVLTSEGGEVVKAALYLHPYRLHPQAPTPLARHSPPCPPMDSLRRTNAEASPRQSSCDWQA
jgi:hypothetical protein